MTKRDRYSATEVGGEEGTLPSFPRADQIYHETKPGIPRRVDTEKLQEKIRELESRLAQTAGNLIVQDGNLIIDTFQLTPTGLLASQSPTQDAWNDLGNLLFRLEGSIQWLIGDWLNFGIDLQYGDIPRIAEILGRDDKTLHNYKQVCDNIEFARRRADLTFGHHDVVRALDPDAQDAALAFAAEHKLSVSAFRKWIKDQQGEIEPPPLSANETQTFKQISGEIDKLYEIDPGRAKPQQHIQAAQAYQLAAERLENFRRKWGL